MLRITRRLVVGLVVFCLWTAWYQADAGKRYVVFRLGSTPLWEETRSGLHGKLPWPLHTIREFENRLMQYDAQPREIIPKDKKNMVVDTFALFRISDAIQYNRRLQTTANAQTRLDDVIYSEIRNDMGRRDFVDILVGQRDDIMNDVTERTRQQLSEYGLTTTIVRLSRTDLPEENKLSVYGRMNAERQRQAKEFRSLGQETAQQIRAETDKEVKFLTSAAKQEAEKTMGEGDAEATRIYNAAYGRNQTFFELYRGLLAAQKTLVGNNDVRVLLRGDEPHLRVLFDK